MFIRKNTKPFIERTKTVRESFNARTDYIGDFIEDNISASADSKLTTTAKKEDLEKFLASPEEYSSDLRNLMIYHYLSNPDIYQYYSLMKILPQLNYKIQSVDSKNPYNEEQETLIKKTLLTVKHRSLTRDLIGESLIGGCVLIWLGSTKGVYPYVFSDFDFCFPSHRLNGDWVCVLDLEYIKGMKSEREKEAFFSNFKGVVSESDYNKYENNPSDKEVRFIELPQERTVYISGDRVRRNQTISLPYGTQSLFALMHKELLTNVESSVGNKAIKNLGVLKLGNEKVPYLEIDGTVKKAIITGVTKAFKTSADINSSRIPLVSIPDFASLEFPRIEGLSDLNEDKFKESDKEINKATGVPDLSEGNYSSARMNLDLLYKKIAVILENIDDVYDKMIRILLGSKGDSLFFEYVKTQPLNSKEEVDVLLKLQANGFSTKAIVDCLSSVTYAEFISQSITEIEEMKLRERIIPPQSSYTLGTDGASGEDKKEKQIDETNENTMKSKDNNSNKVPKPTKE